MKELAMLARVNDRGRNEYIQRRLIWKITDEQLDRLRNLLVEIRENHGEGFDNFYPKPELFGSEGEVTFEGRELQGEYSDEPKEDEAVPRECVSLMDYLTDYKGEKHDRYSIDMSFVAYDEEGKEIVFPGFWHF